MPIVETKDLSRDYTQGKLTVQALRGVAFSMEAGEFTALMGPSGSGKTTLLNLIGGLDAPTTGSVKVDDQDLARMSAAERSRMRLLRLGFVFQAYNLIPVLSARENTEFVMLLQGIDKDERDQKVTEILKAVGLEGMEDRRPSELSGGQQQRVAVARAIASEPALVLADEPTANLDSKTSEALIETMHQLNQERGVTFLYSTHNPKVMEHASRVVKLVDGEIEEDLRK